VARSRNHPPAYALLVTSPPEPLPSTHSYHCTPYVHSLRMGLQCVACCSWPVCPLCSWPVPVDRAQHANYSRELHTLCSWPEPLPTCSVFVRTCSARGQYRQCQHATPVLARLYALALLVSSSCSRYADRARLSRQVTIIGPWVHVWPKTCVAGHFCTPLFTFASDVSLLRQMH
jgi:hypothetical protein